MNATQRTTPFALTALAALAACGGSTEVQTRTASRPSRTVVVGATTEQRFGGAPAPAARAESGTPLHWTTPEGWEELEPSSLRLANLRPAGHPDAECYVTVLGGAGGGLAANVNRWRAQIGLEPLSEAAVADLPTLDFLGVPATVVDLEGSYSGMGDTAQQGWRLLGLVAVRQGSTLFVKMTGPADVVEAERQAFGAFVASLHQDGPGGHGAADPAQGAPAPMDGGGPAGGSFAYSMPEGWRDAGPRTMREVNLAIGAASECYVTVLSGDGGGVVPNLNRWRGQVGLADLSPAELDALPRLSFLGQECFLLEATGRFTGMGDVDQPDSTLLGTVCVTPAGAVFVKMTGPAAEVAGERERFVEFVESLEVRQ